jgi:hypothetical protein
MTLAQDIIDYFSSGESPYRGGKPGTFADHSDSLANQHGLYIDIYAMHAKARVAFKAFLTSFQDSFDTGLDVNTFVGHAEPVRKMRSVDRQIQIGLDLPASNAVQAKRNLHDVSKLVRMIYPLVDKKTDVGVERAFVKAGGDPIFKVKFKNLITGNSQNPVGNARVDGLRGYIGNINYSFDLPSGFFHDVGPHTKGAHKGAADTSFIYPQLINLSFSFFPFNETLPAWTMSGDEAPGTRNIKFTRPNHPYAWTSEGSTLLDSWASTSANKISKVTAMTVNKALNNKGG